MSQGPNNPTRLDPLGAAYCAAAAMLFACKGIFAKKLYALGVSVDAVVMLRGVIALPMFWVLALRREPFVTIAATPWRAIATAAFAGALCYYVGAMLDFVALTMIEASIERVLIFSYPAMVVLFTAVRDRRRPANAVLLAGGLTYVGIFFTVGGFDLAELTANLLGALLVIGSALTYAIYFLISEKYTREIGSARFTLFAMSAAPICLLVHFGVQRDFAELATIRPSAWALLVGIAVLCMFLPASLHAEGVRRLGAERGSVLSTVGPPTTVLLAWALLGERLIGWQFLGIALIVIGVLALDLSRRRAPQPPESDVP